MFLVIASVLCLTAVSATPIHHHNIHKRMTPIEVQKVFGTPHEQVPEYKMASITVSQIQKRDTENYRVLVLNTDTGTMHFVLRPADGYLASKDTPVTSVVKRGSAGFDFTDIPGVMERIGTLMESPKTSSLFIVGKDRNRRSIVNGYIGTKKLMIRALPERLSDSSANGTTQHVIFKRETQSFHGLDRRIREADLELQPERLNLWHSSLRHPVPSSFLRLSANQGSMDERIEVPDTIYPQILVSVDSTVFDSNGMEIDTVIIYHLILWHSVNVRYRTLSHPKVRINIARFVIALRGSGSPYIEDADMSHEKINTYIALNNAKKFWYEAKAKIPSPSYDAVVMFTAKQTVLTPQRLEEGEQLPELKGGAVANSMCVSDEALQLFEPVAILRDNGDIDSHVVAHQLGHMLGMGHDSKYQNQCDENDNYIMARTLSNDASKEEASNYGKFSECSIEMLRKDLQTYNRSCLYNIPETERDILPEILQHAYLALPDACREKYGNEAYSCGHGKVSSGDECTVLYCQLPGRACFKSVGIPLDGTPCDDGEKICEMGRCISR